MPKRNNTKADNGTLSTKKGYGLSKVELTVISLFAAVGFAAINSVNAFLSEKFEETSAEPLDQDYLSFLIRWNKAAGKYMPLVPIMALAFNFLTRKPEKVEPPKSRLEKMKKEEKRKKKEVLKQLGDIANAITSGQQLIYTEDSRIYFLLIGNPHAEAGKIKVLLEKKYGQSISIEIMGHRLSLTIETPTPLTSEQMGSIFEEINEIPAPPSLIDSSSRTQAVKGKTAASTVTLFSRDDENRYQYSKRYRAEMAACQQEKEEQKKLRQKQRGGGKSL